MRMRIYNANGAYLACKVCNDGGRRPSDVSDHLERLRRIPLVLPGEGLQPQLVLCEGLCNISRQHLRQIMHFRDFWRG